MVLDLEVSKVLGFGGTRHLQTKASSLVKAHNNVEEKKGGE